MEQLPPACPAMRVRANSISEKKLVILGYGTGRGNSAGHRGEPSVLVKSLY